MPPAESRVLPSDPPRVNDYDVLAEAYAASNETSLFNAYYGRPAFPDGAFDDVYNRMNVITRQPAGDYQPGQWG